MATHYINFINGDDAAGTGSESNPFKSITPLLADDPPILQPQDILIFVNTEIGQPNFIFNLSDTGFWSDSPSSTIYNLLRTLQWAVLADIEIQVRNTQPNWYIKFAEQLQHFSSTFPVFARELDFESFRKRLIDVWLAFQESGTVSAFNRIVGAYTSQPPFVRKLTDMNSWAIIGESDTCSSYLDQEEFFLFSQREYRTGVHIELFDRDNIPEESQEEILSLLPLLKDLVPLRFTWHTGLNSGEGYAEDKVFPASLLIGKGQNIQGMTGINMTLDSQGAAVVTDIEFQGILKTFPIDVTTVASIDDIIEFRTFQRIFSESVVVEIEQRQGDSDDESDSSYTEFTDIDLSNPFFELEKPYVQFRFKVSGILRQSDYEFVSLMVRKKLEVFTTQ